MTDHLAMLMGPVARELLGEPNKELSSAKELRFGARGSLSVDLEKGVWHDHEAGEGGGLLDLITRATGAKEKARFEWLKDHGYELPDRRTTKKPSGNIENRTVSAPRPNGAGKLGPIVATYDYTDEHEDFLFQVTRHDPKDFRQRTRNEFGEWVWSVKGVRQVPYRLPYLIEALASERLVFVVEGEKDVDNLRKLGVPATTNASGAGKWPGALDQYFAGADVVIIADNDPQKRHPLTGEPMFHDDGRPILPGQDHAQDVARHLSGIAARVRVLDLGKVWPACPPKGDISDWIAAGGTAAALYALIEPLPDWDKADDGTPQPPDAARRKALKVREPLGRDRRPITERPWEIPKFAMRGELTVLVAPPGAGKTTLTQQVMHAASGGIEFAGFAITKPLKVLVFHWEDDEPEMDRKVQAIEDRMGVNPHPENLMTVYCGAGDDEDDDDLILAHYEAKTDKFTPTLGFDDVDAIVAEHAPAIVVIDPLANAFEGPEGNELLKRMGRLMRKLARRRNVAVILILHSKKYADAMAGNMDAARNAGTLVGRIRVGLTLFPMTEEEAERHNIAPARRRRFVRLDDGKQSYGSTDETQWFEIRETILRIDEDRMVSVGVFDPWEPQALFHDLSIPTIHAILRDIDTGVIGATGEPTGELFQPGRNAGHWAGDVIIKHIPDCPGGRAKAILARWKKDGLLQPAPFENAHRKKRTGLKSNPAKWPGTET